MKFVLSAALLLLLVACAPPGPPHAFVATDEFTPNFVIDSPTQSKVTLDNRYTWCLHSVVDKKTHEVTHGLYFTTNYMGKSDPLMSAHDDQSNTINIGRLHTDYGYFDSSYPDHQVREITEKAVLLFTGKYLQKREDTGFRIKIMSRDGMSFILPISPQLIKLQLDATDKYAHDEN